MAVQQDVSVCANVSHVCQRAHVICWLFVTGSMDDFDSSVNMELHGVTLQQVQSVSPIVNQLILAYVGHVTRLDWCKWLHMPLYNAAASGDAAMVRTLLAAGASAKCVKRYSFRTGAHCEKRDVMSAAVRSGSTEVVQILLSAGASPDASNAEVVSPLHCAAMTQNADMVRTLVAAGACVEQCATYHSREGSGLYRKYHSTVLEAVVRANFTAMIQPLIDLGARKLDSALHLAVSPEAVGILVRAGADINNRELFTMRTPLEEAALRGQVEKVQVLLDVGAELGNELINAMTECCGWPVFHYLVKRGGHKEFYAQAMENAVCGHKFRLIESLLEAGVNANMVVKQGLTALQLACKRDSLQCARVLLQFDANEEGAREHVRNTSFILREMLDRAPEDRRNRAWKRRGWIVTLRHRAQKQVAKKPKVCGTGLTRVLYENDRVFHSIVLCL